MARCTALIDLMEQQGHSITALAKTAGVSRSTIIRYREGRQVRPGATEVRLIATVLSVDPDWLRKVVLQAAHDVAPEGPVPHRIAAIAALKAQLAQAQQILDELERQASALH